MSHPRRKLSDYIREGNEELQNDVSNFYEENLFVQFRFHLLLPMEARRETDFHQDYYQLYNNITREYKDAEVRKERRSRAQTQAAQVEKNHEKNRGFNQNDHKYFEARRRAYDLLDEAYHRLQDIWISPGSQKLTVSDKEMALYRAVNLRTAADNIIQFTLDLSIPHDFTKTLMDLRVKYQIPVFVNRTLIERPIRVNKDEQKEKVELKNIDVLSEKKLKSAIKNINVLSKKTAKTVQFNNQITISSDPLIEDKNNFFSFNTANHPEREATQRTLLCLSYTDEVVNVMFNLIIEAMAKNISIISLLKLFHTWVGMAIRSEKQYMLLHNPDAGLRFFTYQTTEALDFLYDLQEELSKAFYGEIQFKALVTKYYQILWDFHKEGEYDFGILEAQLFSIVNFSLSRCSIEDELAEAAKTSRRHSF